MAEKGLATFLSNIKSLHSNEETIGDLESLNLLASEVNHKWYALLEF